MNGEKALNSEMVQLADAIGGYIMEKYVEPRLARNVSYFRATVTQAATDGKITVQRPFDANPLALPYVSSAAGLTAGQQCVVLVLGNMSNSLIIGDGVLSNL